MVGPRIPVTVTEDTNSCWTFRVDYSTHHWQSNQYCAKGRVLQETNESTFQSFDFVAFVDRTLSGSQAGFERYDMWYSVLDGLPVETVRHVDVKSSSPIGTVTYTENGSYSLTSLTPQR